jgi:hypothetical protein
MRKLLTVLFAALSIGAHGQTLIKPLNGGTGIANANANTLTISAASTVSGTNTGDNAANSSSLAVGATAADSSKLGGALPAAYALTAQTMNIGTTAVAINRGSAALVLTGITSIDGSAATLGGATFAAPGAIGGGTPGSGAFTSGTFSTTLGVTGAATFASSILLANNQQIQALDSAGTPHNILSLLTTNDTKLNAYAGQGITFQIANVEKMRLDSSGNLSTTGTFSSGTGTFSDTISAAKSSSGGSTYSIDVNNASAGPGVIRYGSGHSGPSYKWKAGVSVTISDAFEIYDDMASASRFIIAKTTGAVTIPGTLGVTGAITATGGVVGNVTGTASGNLVSGGALGTPSSGTGTNITNVNAATLSGATFAAPGAIGGTTPGSFAGTSLALSGNQTFSQTGARIIAPSSSTTLANNISAQTSTADSGTYFQVIANGTGAFSQVMVVGGSDPNNASYFRINSSTIGAVIDSTQSGTGVARDINFRVSNVNALTLAQSTLLATFGGAVTIPGTLGVTGAITATGGVVGNVTGTASGNLVSGGALGTPSSGTGTNITNVNAATLSGATFAAPGAIGGTTPGSFAGTSLALSGNQTFSQTGARIIAPSSSTTLANNISAQTSTADSGTYFQVIANGTGAFSQVMVVGGSDPNNASYFRINSSTIGAVIDSTQSGTGVARDINFRVSNVNALTLAQSTLLATFGGAVTIPGTLGVTGNVGIGVTPVSKLQVSGHIGTAGSIPAVSACGTSPAITTGSTDTAGEITQGAIATGCVITFAAAYPRAPFCVVTSEAGLAFSYIVAAGTITITNIGALSSTKANYHCIQNDLL